MTRIGPQMARAIEYVRNHPGCAIRPVAHEINPCPDPTRNEAFGYEPVHRAIRAGLIHARSGGGGRYALYVDPEVGSERYIMGEIIGLAFASIGAWS